MRHYAICAALLAGIVTLIPEKSYGLAAISNGARTSCKPTAPAGTPLYRTQVNCDPADVQSFSFHITYDSALVAFDANVEDEGSPPPPGGVVGLNGYAIDSIMDVTGVFDGPPPEFRTLLVTGHFDEDLTGRIDPSLHVDVVGIDFDLLDHTNVNAPLFFSVGEAGDTITTFENTVVTLTDADTTTADLTMAEIHATPLPSAAWGGIGLIGGLGIWRGVRARKTLAVIAD